MLFEKLPKEEVTLIDWYRREYAYHDSGNRRGRFCEISHLLREWDIKKDTLYRLLGNNFIISKEIHYEKSMSSLQAEMDWMTSGYRAYGREGRSGREFYRSYNDWIASMKLSDEEFDTLWNLMAPTTLVENRYDGHTCSLTLPNGKEYKITNGCKPLRALGKIADAFGLKGFEDFRICHSQVLNQKSLSGTLTLSIHPLDYMTMSDNECDWDSCMSWKNEGGYRLGTVEMMNSTNVIVAYLTADEDMRIPGGSWNNKKWRQLFVVDPLILAGVKAYPYANDDLTCAVISWLKELAATNMHWEYKDAIKYDYVSNDYLISDDNVEYYIDMASEAMYNDFGCQDYHWIAVNSNIVVDDLCHSYGENYCMRIDYSGREECMVCGDISFDYDDESCLACSNCESVYKCEMCGERVYEDDAYEVDGLYMCCNCYDRYAYTCDSCEAEHHEDNMLQIRVACRLSEEELRNCMENPTLYDSRGLDRESITDMIRGDHTIAHICEHDSDCMEKWIANNMKPGCRPKRYRINWSLRNYVFFDELNEEAQKELIHSWLFIGKDRENMSHEELWNAEYAHYPIHAAQFIKTL